MLSHVDVESLIVYRWFATGLLWIVGAFAAKRTTRPQSASSRLLHITLRLLALAVGYSKRFEFGLFARPFVPASPAVGYTDLAFALVGISFAVWARLLLGGNWSGTVTVKEGHTLVRRDPYAIVRHPI